MRRRSPIVLSLLFFCVLPVSASLTHDTTSQEVLTLEAFIRLATQKDTAFEEILINALTLRYQKDLRLPARDLVLSVREELSFFMDHDENDAATQVGLSKLFPYSGTNVSLDYGVTPLSGASGRTSGITFSVTQPIAENAFGRSTRLLDKIVGLEVDVARHQIIEAYEDYMAAIITGYLDWYKAYADLQIGRSSYQQNIRLQDNILERRKSQIALPIDVNKVKLQVMATNESLIDLEEAYQRAYHFIRRAIRHAGEESYRPAAPDSVEWADARFEDAFTVFRSTGRTYKILDLLEARSTLVVEREAHQLLPSVALSAGYAREGDNLKMENREDKVFTGVSLNWPFPDQRDRAEHKISEIETRRTRLENENIHYRLYNALQDLSVRMESEKKLMAIADEKIALAETVLKDESENYTFGRVTLNDYIQAVNSLDSNRFNQVSHLVAWRRLFTEWLRLTDQLVNEKQIQDRHEPYAPELEGK